eukprot:gnl/Hemi2/17809_TR5873_c0_g1_i1.p1 gnl/Hemi2/17809_TR5873_c0_g1~~gnl/Hemi2/17809_TR5873_c0_g1_i1.p1  ORF type:complete len:392 (-),score=136.76 gnl/Hemi2/17809_TR5873_c0_g1_i1:19-1128(-)
MKQPQLVVVAFATVVVLLCLHAMPVTASLIDCPALPPHTPVDVHDLRPDSFKVVMALGDSLTTGFGVYPKAGLKEDLTEYRGVSWSIGADENSVTVATLLKYFSPTIVGGSDGNHTMELCWGALCPPYQYRPSIDVLNAAQSGAQVSNLVSQVKYLGEQLQKMPNVNVQEDWKLLTIFIGANDLCFSCVPFFGTKPLSADAFEAHLRAALEAVRAALPRVFVNLVELFNVSGVWKLSQTDPHCSADRHGFPLECTCGFENGTLGDTLREQMDARTQEYNARMYSIQEDYATANYSDFAVVVQPLFDDLSKLPVSFFSPLDCFHPAAWAHGVIATHLWNNMLVPRARKVRDGSTTTPVACPTPDTLIYTN